MSKMTEYRVVRRHDGDRLYNVGDTRTALETEVKHLIPHVLEPIGPAPEPAAKAEPDHANKAEGAAAANKAATGRKSR
jgi:hypothetical protein